MKYNLSFFFLRCSRIAQLCWSDWCWPSESSSQEKTVFWQRALGKSGFRHSRCRCMGERPGKIHFVFCFYFSIFPIFWIWMFKNDHLCVTWTIVKFVFLQWCMTISLWKYILFFSDNPFVSEHLSQPVS